MFACCLDPMICPACKSESLMIWTTLAPKVGFYKSFCHKRSLCKSYQRLVSPGTRQWYHHLFPARSRAPVHALVRPFLQLRPLPTQKEVLPLFLFSGRPTNFTAAFRIQLQPRTGSSASGFGWLLGLAEPGLGTGLDRAEACDPAVGGVHEGWGLVAA